MRSDIPIYAFTRHEATQRRVTLYRGVYPVDFDVTHPRPEQIYAAIFERLMQDGLAAEGDLIIVTKGEFSGVSGGTNSMKILKVQRQPHEAARPDPGLDPRHRWRRWPSSPWPPPG